MKKEPTYPLFKILIPTKKQEITDLLGSEENVWLYERTIEDLKQIAVGTGGFDTDVAEASLDTKAGQYEWVFSEIERWIEDSYRVGLENMKAARAKVRGKLR